MDFGRLPEHIFERSVYKVIHTTEYQSRTLDGAGLGADCAILPFAEGLLATAQGQAYGVETDVTVGVRALQHALNRLACSGVIAKIKSEQEEKPALEKAQITAQLSIAMPHFDAMHKGESFGEPFFREIIRRTADLALQSEVTITGVETSTIPDIKAPIVTAFLTAHAAKDNIAAHGTKPVDQDIVMTKWLGLEGTSLIASQRKEELLTRYPLGLIEDAADFDRFLSIVPEAATAVQSGVSAMQVVRDGGIFGGLWQLAQANGVGLVIDLKKIPVKQETIEVCEFYDVNPYELLSGGTLLLITDNGARLSSLLMEQGIAAAVIGRTTDHNDRILVNDEEKRFLEPARHDSLYKVLVKP